MLYGEYPFFGLSEYEIMNQIEASSGSRSCYQGNKLKFNDSKNQVSDKAKDLLRRLLTPDPDQRISWEEFFASSIFQTNSEQTSVDDKNIKGIQNLLQRELVDNEFQENTRTSKDVERKVELKADSMEKIPGQIGDTQIIDSDSLNTSKGFYSDVKSLFREYSFRYFHEKNKVLMIYLTVKKLRQLMKEPVYTPQIRPLFLLMCILAKKGAMLSELTLMSLKMKNNIFKLKNFEDYCTSQEYFETIGQMVEDQKSIFEYRDYIFNLKGDLTLGEKEREFITGLTQTYVDLKGLDERAKLMLSKVREADGSVLGGQMEDKPKHFYLLTMIFCIYSIRSEDYLPYITENKKFEWDTFKEKHENISWESLWRVLNALTINSNGT
jgi:serine/threonine protein kinase